MPAFEDLTGRAFGKLTVIKRVDDLITPSGQSKRRWLCRCSCPEHNEVVVLASHLKSGHTTSCGCESRRLSAERLAERDKARAKHGKYLDPIYKTYSAMLDRCVRNKKTENHPSYTKNNISICKEWYDPDKATNGVDVDGFRNFYNWSMMIGGYSIGKTIDRINPLGNYEPSNCRWATPFEQANNKTIQNFVEYNRETFTIGQWANIFGFNYDWLYNQLYPNFDMYSLFQPYHTNYGNTYIAYNWLGNPVPMNAIYFIDQYGFPVSEANYQPPAPIPALWNVDDKGFVTTPII